MPWPWLNFAAKPCAIFVLEEKYLKKKKVDEVDVVDVVDEVDVVDVVDVVDAVDVVNVVERLISELFVRV